MRQGVIQGYFTGGGTAPAPIQPSAPAPRPHGTAAGPPPRVFAGQARTAQATPALGRPAPTQVTQPHPGQPHPAQPSTAQPSVAQPYAAQPASAPQHGDRRFEIDPVAVGLVRGGGQPLPPAVLEKMEAAFGADFSTVRIHVGGQAPRIGAVAFTMGHDLYFAPGSYQPDSIPGQQLIGHELAHVVQQRQGRVRAQGSGVTVVQDRVLEAEADRLGQWAALFRPEGSARPVLMQRFADSRHIQMSSAPKRKLSGQGTGSSKKARKGGKSPDLAGAAAELNLSIHGDAYETRNTQALALHDDGIFMATQREYNSFDTAIPQIEEKFHLPHEILLRAIFDNRAEDEGIHAEMGIISQWLTGDIKKPRQIGASQPPCLRCALVCKILKISVTPRGNGNLTQNWVHPFRHANMDLSEIKEIVGAAAYDKLMKLPQKVTKGKKYEWDTSEA